MAKPRNIFYCTNCGNEALQWAGKCSSCNEWNTLKEKTIHKETTKNSFREETNAEKKPVKFSAIDPNSDTRVLLTDSELNRVLGGGLVPGSLILIGGDPGIGKSTLMLQLALSNPGLKIMYVSGEESEKQLKMRSERFATQNSDFLIFTGTSTAKIKQIAKEVSPDLLIIDSVQTLYSPSLEGSPGSLSQIRETTAELMQFAKQTNTAIFLIGHITKDGAIAGPKLLEHMVDTVLQFEGDRNYIFRLLRAQKNRFGSTNELGIYEMTGKGLREVSNPSELLINQSESELSGSAIAATVEGMRPLLIEIQALVSTAVYGTPQRVTTGYDARRLNMLLAVLEKRCGFRLGQKDVFLNIAGGVRVDDIGIDLAVIAAILSSNADIPLPRKVAFCAEVGLSGELRAVSRTEQRIIEAEKLGFDEIILAAGNGDALSTKHKITITSMNRVERVFTHLFSDH